MSNDNNNEEIKIEENEINISKNTTAVNKNISENIAVENDINEESIDDLESSLEDEFDDESENDEGSEKSTEGKVEFKKLTQEERDKAYLERLEAKRAAQKIEFGKHLELFLSKITEAGLSKPAGEAIQDFVEYLVSSSTIDIRDDIRYLKRSVKASKIASLRPSSMRPPRSPRPAYREGGEGGERRYENRENRDDRYSGERRYDDRPRRPSYSPSSSPSYNREEGSRYGADRRYSGGENRGGDFRRDSRDSRDSRGESSERSDRRPSFSREGFKPRPR